MIKKQLLFISRIALQEAIALLREYSPKLRKRLPILLMKKNANLTFTFFENLIWTLNTCTIYIKGFKEKVHGLLNIHETIKLLFTND